MKTTSIRYLADGGLEPIEIDVADPGPGEVQVEGSVCGICAWDLYTFRHGSSAPCSAPPGHEGMGRVTRLGPGVKNVKEGDRVVGNGFAGVYNKPANRIYAIPDVGIPDEQWIVEPVSCSVTGVDICRVKAGDRIVLIGCGFMGLMIVQCLARSFAQQLVVIDINDDRLKLAAEFGATETINSSGEDIDERIKQLNGRFIDTVIDCTGSQDGLDMATKIVRTGGLINLFGWNHGPVSFSGDAWHLGGFTVVNSSPSAKLRDTFPTAIRLIASGIVRLEPLITHVVDLDGYGPLLDRVTTGQEPGYIKGVVRLT